MIIILNMEVMLINKNLSLQDYLNKIKPYLRDIIIDLQESDLKISICFFLQNMLMKSV